MELELIRTIVFTTLMGILPVLSIVNTLAISKLPDKDITGKGIGLIVSLLLLLPSIIILLSCLEGLK